MEPLIRRDDNYDNAIDTNKKISFFWSDIITDTAFILYYNFNK
jgi:uncharacterized protein Veg